MSTLVTDDGGIEMARRRTPRTGLDPVAVEFGKRLVKAIADKGWTQADFAREATKRFGKDLRRDNISLYARGLQLPGPARLSAICRTLGVKESDLLIPGAASDPESPPFAVRPLEGDKVWLQINQETDFDTSLAIAALLKKEKK